MIDLLDRNLVLGEKIDPQAVRWRVRCELSVMLTQRGDSGPSGWTKLARAGRAPLRITSQRSVARRTSLCAARAELAQARRLSRTSGASNSFANPLQARQDDTHWFCSHRYGKGTDICGLDVRNQLSLWSFLWGGGGDGTLENRGRCSTVS